MFFQYLWASKFSTMSTYLKNLDIYAEEGFIKNGSILIEGEKIAKVFTTPDAGVKADEVIDCKGDIAIPGYIDSHVHGGGGHDIGDGSLDAILKTRDFYAGHGVTTIYPTFMTNKLDIIEEGLKAMREAVKTNAPGKAFIAGCHIEGPFLNPAKKGCQSEELIIPLDDENMKLFEEYHDVIDRITLAPEYKNNADYIPRLVELGIQVSIGHSIGNIEDVEKAMAKGATSITHLHNAQSGMHKEGPFRIGGVTEAGLTIDDLYTEVISDGFHVPNFLMKITYRCKGADKMIIVSDASLCAGMPTGTVVRTSGVDFYVEDGIAMNEARTSLASSTSSMDQMVRHMIFDVNLPKEEVVRMSSANLCKLMDIYEIKGSIKEGKLADINIVDEGFNVKKSFFRGK